LASPGHEIAAFLIALLVVVAVVAFVVIVPHQNATPISICSASSSATEATTLVPSNAPSAYDEGLWLAFRQNFTSIAYNVTAIAQNDSYGVGPAYLLNGLTDMGYWYQVGISWDWGYSHYTGYSTGFEFIYEVWNTHFNESVLPTVGVGLAGFNGTVNSGDSVLLSLSFGPGYNVIMQAKDTDTSASASLEYPSYGASTFMGTTSKPELFGTSLLTEWYHVTPNYCSDREVIFSNMEISLSSAWLGIHEFNLSGSVPSPFFNSNDNPHLYYFYQSQLFNLSSSSLQSYSGLGTTIYANAHEFITM